MNLRVDHCGPVGHFLFYKKHRLVHKYTQKTCLSIIRLTIIWNMMNTEEHNDGKLTIQITLKHLNQ